MPTRLTILQRRQRQARRGRRPKNQTSSERLRPDRGDEASNKQHACRGDERDDDHPNNKFKNEQREDQQPTEPGAHSRDGLNRAQNMNRLGRAAAMPHDFEYDSKQGDRQQGPGQSLHQPDQATDEPAADQEEARVTYAAIADLRADEKKYEQEEICRQG